MRISESIKRIAPYKAGKPIEELEREIGIKGIIKLASNENPLGPSPLALKAIQQSQKLLFRYPDSLGHDLIQKLANRLKVSPAQIALGNGSNELIELLTRAFLLPGDEVVMADLTFSLYKIMAEVAHSEPVMVPLINYRHDLDRMAEKINERTRMIIICNPNNPTGTLLRRDQIIEFIQKVPSDTVVVLDHAYEEYVTDPAFSNMIDEVEGHENLIILRTFSKIYGLAGMRIGYGIASESMIEILNKVRQPFNTSLLSQRAAFAALDDLSHIKASQKTNVTGKKYLYQCFKELNVQFIPSEANFIFFQINPGKALFDWMLREGVIIRHIKGDWMRVTIGRPRENQMFIRKLQQFLKIK